MPHRTETFRASAPAACDRAVEFPPAHGVLTILTHQIILHPDLAPGFAAERSITPYKRRFGFSWYLCPVTLFEQSAWLLINVEFGYCHLVETPSATALTIEEAAITAIDHHLPVDRDEDNVSVSYRPNDVTWHTAAKIPEHVGGRYQQAQQLLDKCVDRFDPEEVMDRLNSKPLTLGGRTFAPVDGLEGLLLELADDFRHYLETTPWWRLQWHMWTRRAAWLEQRAPE